MFLSTRTSSPVLFDQWNTNDLYGLVMGMSITIVLGIIFESMHLIESRVPIVKRNGHKVRCANVTIKSVLHVMRVTIGYLLMLCVMTFNVWILISVLVGCAIGYFLFRPWYITPNQTHQMTGTKELYDPLLVKESTI